MLSKSEIWNRACAWSKNKQEEEIIWKKDYSRAFGGLLGNSFAIIFIMYLSLVLEIPQKKKRFLSASKSTSFWKKKKKLFLQLCMIYTCIIMYLYIINHSSILFPSLPPFFLFTYHNVYKVHPCYNIYQYCILLYGKIADLPYFVFLLIGW